MDLSWLISAVMILAAAAYVATPFFAAGAQAAGTVRPARNGSANARAGHERRKHEAYAAIKEAEFDLRMGKLSETDFAAIREKYVAEAVSAITALDQLQTSEPRHIGSARRSARIAFCPACGHGVPPRANFCPACGRSLTEAVA